MRRRFLLFALVALAPWATAAEVAPAGPFDRVAVPPAKTSIYFGTVTMTMPDFHRTGNSYESSYAAKVVPFFFASETGRITIEISDEMLARLEKGEPCDFHGRGVRDDGAERRIEGTAIPIDNRAGKLKVRVIVSRHLELIFNTTYRFED